jgi:ferric-chelate reductase
MLLVDYIDILIAALIGFLALFRLPRALVRLRKRSEWSQGHFFQYKARNSQELSGSSHESDAIPTKEPLSSATTSEAHAFYNHGDRRQLLKMAEATQPSYPPHMPTYPAFLRPFAEYLSLSIVSGYSNWQALVMLAYLGILLYAFSYDSNFLNNPRRSGIIAASQLPFLYAFASKNSVPGSLLGIGYQSVRCSLYV